jgi:hypothetical protein
MAEIKPKKNWTLIILFFLLGIILGMILMYLLFVIGITTGLEKILNSNSGLIQNIEINFNETKLVDRAAQWAQWAASQNASQNTSQGIGLSNSMAWNDRIYIWSAEENIFYTYFTNGTCELPPNKFGGFKRGYGG